MVLARSSEIHEDVLSRPAAPLSAVLDGFSIEVMPRTAAKVESFAELFPAKTRIYIAHIEGTPIDDMVATATRIAREGFPVMPHIPARLLPDEATFRDWLTRYRDEAGVDQALVLAGGLSKPAGAYENSMQLLESGVFDALGYKRLHVAGHPEGNRDIDPDGSTRMVDEAVQWKQAFSERTDAEMALVTQFVFEAQPVIDWAEGLKQAGVSLPIHFGVAGPAKLQTMLKFAVSCGVGPSLRVLKRRAKDITKLLKPHEPTAVLKDMADHMEEFPDSLVSRVHVFPFGGIRTAAEYVARQVSGEE